MKQLSLYDYCREGAEPLTVEELFCNDLKVQDDVIEPSPTLQMPKVYHKGYYVRTVKGHVHKIDDIGQSASTLKYKECKNRMGKVYLKKYYEKQPVIFSEYYENGKMEKELIYDTDVLEVQPCLIDCIYKDDYVYDSDYHICRVVSKRQGKIITVKEFLSSGEMLDNPCPQTGSKHSTTVLVCIKNGQKVLLKDGDILSKYNVYTRYIDYLRVGDKVLSRKYGWCTVTEIMSKKVMCTSPSMRYPFMVMSADILDVLEV